MSKAAGCQGKIAYETQHKAFRTILKQSKRGYAVQAYRCKYCAKWHVGRAEKMPKTLRTDGQGKIL